jgi:hypothetical protein
MDGSTVVIPTAKPPAGLAREDALFRIVYYGEALRAMTEHVSDTLISGPCVPMIEMLDEAFDRMSQTRDSFGPEEFTLFVMSKMLGLCDDVDEARQFQVGAAQYILKSADSLPEAYQAVIDDARQMLRRSEPLGVTAEPAASPPQAEEATDEQGARIAEPAPSRPAATDDAAPADHVTAAAPAPRPPAPPARAVAPARDATPYSRVTPTAQPQQHARASAAPAPDAARSGAAPVAVTSYSRTAQVPPNESGAAQARMHLAPVHGVERPTISIERVIGIIVVVIAFGFWVMVMTGYIDLVDFQNNFQREPFRMPQ